jgi:hypothetical protein
MLRVNLTHQVRLRERDDARISIIAHHLLFEQFGRFATAERDAASQIRMRGGMRA